MYVDMSCHIVMMIYT